MDRDGSVEMRFDLKRRIADKPAIGSESPEVITEGCYAQMFMANPMRDKPRRKFDTNSE
jgi:hypothetical protein